MRIYKKTSAVAKVCITTCIAVFLFALTVLPAASEIAVPDLRGRVNDYAAMLSSETVRTLEAHLASLEQSDSTQIAVLTISSLEGEAIESFGMRVAEQWKIGQGDTDNGALLIVSKKDRKLRIEVGYGLEGTLTDLVAGQIIRNVIVPRFKQGRFDQGIVDGVHAMTGVVKGEYTAIKKKNSGKSRNDSGGIFFVTAFLLFFLSNLARANKVVGSSAGGILLPFFAFIFFHPGPLILLALLPVGAGLGYVLGLLAPVLFANSGHSVHGGGLYPGGGRGGFDSSGGFGGFSGGGGGFGGGGASGGW
jgi:uncharacterized protein